MRNNMDSKTKVGFIGFGNMGSAICDGLIKVEAVSTSNIFACANNWDKLLKETESRQIKACKNAKELVKNADMIVVAVKPNMVEKVIEPVKNELKGKIIVSIAAGCNADFYEKLLGNEYNYIVTMPNTPISICEGVLLCEDNHRLKAEQLECFMGIFTAVATVEFIESKVFSVAGAMSGCGPAFVAMFIEALGDAGVKYAIGNVVSGTVARMTDFGAFVELELGVDALLHVSQIAVEHVDKPSDVLKVGDKVEAKIVDFNEEDKKISLSVKALKLEEAAKNQEVNAEEAASEEVKSEE